VPLGENEGEASWLHDRGVGGWPEGRGAAVVAGTGWRQRHEPTGGGRRHDGLTWAKRPSWAWHAGRPTGKENQKGKKSVGWQDSRSKSNWAE
jgi:hypothetical protein